MLIFTSNFDSDGIEDDHCCDTKKRYGTGRLFKSQDDSHLDVTILGPGDLVSTIPFCPLRYRYQLCYKFGIALTTDDPSVNMQTLDESEMTQGRQNWIVRSP